MPCTANVACLQLKPSYWMLRHTEATVLRPPFPSSSVLRTFLV